MDAFSRNQEDMRERMLGAFGSNPGYSMFEESIKKNMELYGQAMKMFSPSGGNMYGNANETTNTPSEAGDIDELKSQLAALQNKLDKLEKNGA